MWSLLQFLCILTTFLLCASINFTCLDPEVCIKTCISAISSKDAGRPVTPVVCFYFKATQNAFPVQARTTGQAADTCVVFDNGPPCNVELVILRHLALNPCRLIQLCRLVHPSTTRRCYALVHLENVLHHGRLLPAYLHIWIPSLMCMFESFMNPKVKPDYFTTGNCIQLQFNISV